MKKPGGLNEYGIAAYKTVDDFAQAGGGLYPGRRRNRAASTACASVARLEPGRPAPRAMTPSSWASGLGAVNDAGHRRGRARRRHGRRRLHRSSAPGVGSRDPSGRPPHRGHRRRHDRDRHRQPDQAPGRGGRHHRLSPRPRADERLAITSRSWRKPTACCIRHWLRPTRLLAEDGRLTGVELEYTRRGAATGRPGDPALRASFSRRSARPSCRPMSIGSRELVELEHGRIRVDAERRTSLPASGPAATAWPAARTSRSPRSRTASRRPCRSTASSRRAIPHAKADMFSFRHFGAPPPPVIPAQADNPACYRTAGADQRHRLDGGRLGRSPTGAKPWPISRRVLRHQGAQPVLAGLGAADRQGLQRRARLQGRLGRCRSGRRWARTRRSSTSTARATAPSMPRTAA